MRVSRGSFAFSVALAWLLVAFPTPTRAGVDVDFGAAVRLGDDANLFFSISSRYFDRERPVVETWGSRFTNPDDLSVFFFLVGHSGRTPDEVWSLRRRGLSWWEVGVRIGVPVDVWFVPVSHDPGPPYGKAYGHWKKHKHGKKPSSRMGTLSDADARNLVAVRMIHEYYRVPVETAMEMRSSGRDVRTLMANEYDKRHHREMKASKEKPNSSKKPRAKDPHGDSKESRHHHED